MNTIDKSLVILHGEIETPRLSTTARRETGRLLRQLQRGVTLSMPHSRPLPVIGARVHEFRINDGQSTWRIIYRIDAAEILVAEFFAKKTQSTPHSVIDSCWKRLRDFDHA